MSEIGNMINNSLAQNPVQHAVSASTVSAGAVEKIVSADPISDWDSFISICADLGIIAGLILTCYLIFRAYRADRIERLTMIDLKLRIAERDRRQP
jgi:hypothetical protein